MEIQAPSGACISFFVFKLQLQPDRYTLTLRLSGPRPDTLILDATLAVADAVIAVRIF